MAFKTTRWSLVLQAGDSGEDSTRALEELCSEYWKPVFLYVRGRGFSEEDSKDLVQQFFLHILERKVVSRADPNRGRFRYFVRASIRNFLANEWDKGRAQKRGGGRARISIDAMANPGSLGILSDEGATPDTLFERAWALALIENVLRALEKEWNDRGKSALFEALKSRITGQELPGAYDALSRELGMTESAVKVAAHRMKRRFRELLREAIHETVSSEDELEQELRDLRDVLSGE